jgi:hypothetical protein
MIGADSAAQGGKFDPNGNIFNDEEQEEATRETQSNKL